MAMIVNNNDKFRNVAREETRPMREYMITESIQQYKDFYEGDEEETEFFEYLNNLPNRDKIRFMEIFEDHTVDKFDYKRLESIPKREHNPELNFFKNLAFDLIDFRDRVRPISTDITKVEAAAKYQK